MSGDDHFIRPDNDQDGMSDIGLTVETIEAAFREWYRTITVVDRPSKQEIFDQGYVAGWNAKEAQATDEIERLRPVCDLEAKEEATGTEAMSAMFDDQGRLWIQLPEGKIPPQLLGKVEIFMIEHGGEGRLFLNLTAYIEILAEAVGKIKQ